MNIISVRFDSTGSVHIVVQLPENSEVTTKKYPHIHTKMFALFPDMQKHGCHNNIGAKFKKECENTEIAHLLEHLIIELNSQVYPNVCFKGYTEWNWTTEPRGRYNITINYYSRTVMVSAVFLAVDIIKALDTGEVSEQDISVQIAMLKGVGVNSNYMGVILKKADKFSWEE